ncbi:hypothetical protein PBI_SMARTIES_8 [Microbacterium phage Smarties]|uniref:Uncharacterized protein n=1 Tax=Microbacterium phage Ariadne TaxID=2656546 RepID=A0A649VC88_9CAUD|nr:hypothetical protein QDA10_gp008 [Microbacterium phage Ariadne]QGJ89413.1 hypothetical protein PBI_ARIADNE_8 [Microbacterium phage Ariadne]QGJ91400.1 hypothetical protein PBI_SMARTIES_8 [Microbacterium phage Smarties]
MTATVPISKRVESLAADAALVADAQRRLDILDAYLALPADHPHPQIKRIRDEHASQVATYLIALRNTADLFSKSLSGDDHPISQDEVIAVIDQQNSRMSLNRVTSALSDLGLDYTALRLVLDWMEQQS